MKWRIVLALLLASTLCIGQDMPNTAFVAECSKVVAADWSAVQGKVKSTTAIFDFSQEQFRYRLSGTQFKQCEVVEKRRVNGNTIRLFISHPNREIGVIDYDPDNHTISVIENLKGQRFEKMTVYYEKCPK